MDEIFKDNPEGLVFDCDGTLIDTMPSHLKYVSGSGDMARPAQPFTMK
jgi:phosphoglycolate phosphatase-like HAD superfamily hydrolase